MLIIEAVHVMRYKNDTENKIRGLGLGFCRCAYTVCKMSEKVPYGYLCSTAGRQCGQNCVLLW